MNVKQTRSFLGASPLNAFTNVLTLSLLAGCLCSYAQANPLRYGIEPVVHYTFETDSGSAVTNNQPVVRVDDQSGNNRHLVWANATNAIATYVSTTTTPVGPTDDSGIIARPFYSGYSLSIMGDGKKDPKVSMDNFIFGKPIIPPRAFVLSVR